MKANKAPEKLYIDFRDRAESTWRCAYTEKATANDIEYICTDTFIEKAIKWIEEINNHHHIMRYSDSCEPPISELIEWFKNYIKKEGEQ